MCVIGRLFPLTLSATLAVGKTRFFLFFPLFNNFTFFFSPDRRVLLASADQGNSPTAGQRNERLYKPPAFVSLPHQLIAEQSPEQQQKNNTLQVIKCWLLDHYLSSSSCWPSLLYSFRQLQHVSFFIQFLL